LSQYIAHKEVFTSAAVSDWTLKVTHHNVEIELPDELDFLWVGLLSETRVIGILVDLLLFLDGSRLDVIGVGLLLVDSKTMRVIDEVIGVS
jgi:hypothetical protein